MIAVSTAGAARLRAKPAATDAWPKSDPELVRQHIIDLLTALPDLVPANAAYAARMANLKARFEAFTPEQAAGLAYVDDAALASAVEHLKQAAAERRLRLQTLKTKPVAPNDVNTPLPPANYDSVCGSSTTDINTTKAEVIAQDAAELAAIAGQAACDSIVVIVGEGTTLPLCLIAFALHETVEGIQFARDLQDACDKDVGSVEAHATFGNIYRLHDDLAGVSASGAQNTTTTVNAIGTSEAAIIQEVDSKAAQVIGNANSNRATIIGNDNANRETIVGNDNANRDTIVSNDNTNRNQIIANDNTNRDLIITDMRFVSCELNRLLNTPEGQRSSSISSCAGQPGFPYRFGVRSILNPSPSSTSDGSAPRAGRGQDGVAILPMMGTVTMETNLLEGKLIPSYYLPLRKGGMLEQVRTLVWETINAQLDLNIAVEQTEEARKSALEADQLFVQQRFVEAYRTYSTAYQRLIPQVERVAR